MDDHDWEATQPPTGGNPPAPRVPAERGQVVPSMREMAEELVRRAREEGVELTGNGGLVNELVRQVMQTGLDIEMEDHLGYARGDRAGAAGASNKRNGTTRKTVTTEVGPVQLDVPRDRKGEFEPQTVPKHARRVDGFGGLVIDLYSRGMTSGEVKGHLLEIYGTSVSKDTISRITDGIVEEMKAWQNRPVDPLYPVLIIDAVVIKVRDSQVANRPGLRRDRREPRRRARSARPLARTLRRGGCQALGDDAHGASQSRPD